MVTWLSAMALPALPSNMSSGMPYRQCPPISHKAHRLFLVPLNRQSKEILLKTPANQLHAITLEQITAALDAAHIAYDVRDAEEIYVTGYSFPTFWRVDAERDLLVFSTYLDVMPGASADELLAFVNACNLKFILVQFSYHPDMRRLIGHYVLTRVEGVSIDQAIASGKLFAAIFQDCAEEGVDKSILASLD